MKYRILHVALVVTISLVLSHSTNSDAFQYNISPNKIFIGKDPLIDGDVYLYKFSVVKVKKNIKRAVHSVEIDNITDKHTDEYTSDFNCLDKLMHTTRLIKKENNVMLEQHDLNLNEKVVNDTINGKLLDTVCRINNAPKAPRRK